MVTSVAVGTRVIVFMMDVVEVVDDVLTWVVLVRAVPVMVTVST